MLRIQPKTERVSTMKCPFCGYIESKEIDEVAYVRFASVYRSFKDINSFREEINQLLFDEK